MEEVCVVKHRVLVLGESMRRVARELGISSVERGFCGVTGV